jgi:GNAT superfamily N-acetyltransferase
MAAAELIVSDLVITYELTVETEEEGPTRLFDQWQVRALRRSYTEAGHTDTPVARATLTVIDAQRFDAAGESLLLAGDELGGDLFELITTAFDGNDYHDEFDALQQDYGAALFLDTVWVDPEHRGDRLGLRLAAEAITTLSRGCSVVFTFPAPYEDGTPERSTPEREAMIDRLARYWAKLGFTEFRDGLFYLDTALIQPGLEAEQLR